MSGSPSYIGGPSLQYFCSNSATPSSSVAALILLDPRHQDLLQALGTKLQVFPGFNTPNLIVSGVHTATPQHKEDANAAAMNLLLGGACKAWCVMKQRGMLCFEDELRRNKDRLARTLHKQNFDSLTLACKDPKDVMAMLQYSGQFVITLSGSVWHQTTSTGASLAEASNAWFGCQDGVALAQCIQSVADYQACPEPDLQGRTTAGRDFLSTYFGVIF
jgi:hypothetical protein